VTKDTLWPGAALVELDEHVLRLLPCKQARRGGCLLVQYAGMLDMVTFDPTGWLPDTRNRKNRATNGLVAKCRDA